MRAGERPLLSGLMRAAAALVFVSFTASVGAIDNPDAPDRVASFERRAEPFEKQLSATDGGSAATRAGHAYAAFLDAELNTAYRALLYHLDSPAREALVESQRRWLRFRDADYAFITRHWTRERSGSSASLSIAGYRNTLVKERIVRLLRYAAEYP
jgi:uncharacterized protein YecT (DUF1311 family)